MPTNTFRDCSNAMDAIYTRYGKQVTITGKYDTKEDGTYNWVTLDIVSQKGGKYSLTETFENNATKQVKLLFDGGELVFNRYLDAEVAMIDKIAAE